MIQSLLKKIFGSRNDRLLKQFRAQVAQINALEPAMQALTEEQLRNKTIEFKERLDKGATVDDLLVEAFAVVREGGRRILEMRHFDVQLIGGMVLHSGRIAEMRTGEGKTLVATLAAYLNALTGKGVHVVTVNDYLAARDAEWMGKLYNYLGMTVGVIVSEPSQSTEEKQLAYNADITYGTNSEFGFDYLRDNLVYRIEDRSQQKGLNFAIIDEVDSILIDEARTPLIISGQVEGDTFLYNQTNSIAPLLKRMAHEPKKDQPEPEGDFWVDEKHRQLHLSDAGHERAENLLREQGLLQANERLYDPKNIFLMHHLMASLRAHNLFLEGRDYFVRNGQVMIVDEFTGRPMEGRRWSDGLHQAIEAKEGVRIQPENQSLASITYQNYFRMYQKLSGMTGTADTEAAEFLDIYKLETVIMPTNRAAIRIDQNDQIYKTEFEKFQAIIEDIQRSHEKQQPVLVGTTSIENSEKLSTLLKKLGLKHEVLNAKQHEREAQIVAEAGVPGRITIATNMAGRGTDIILGGNVEKMVKHLEESTELTEAEKQTKIEAIRSGWQAQNKLVKDAGGLRIIGTERHDSRRIDNQLRGRAGRQGDPGSSRFYLSLEDPIMIRMAGEKIRVIMERLKLPDHEPIEAGIMTRQIESAQKRMEGMNYEYRKQLLEYDDVANKQRNILYIQRNMILETEDLNDIFVSKLKDSVEYAVRHNIEDDSVPEQWDLVGLENELADWQLDLNLERLVGEQEDIKDEDVYDHIVEKALAQYHEKQSKVHPAIWLDFMRRTMLIVIDIEWRNQLSALEHLRRGIHLRAYAQKNPKQEYQRESFVLFGMMLENIDTTITQKVLSVEIPENPYQGEDFSHEDQVAYGDNQIQPDNTDIQLAEIEDYDNTGRNQPCPCGSGKKFKHCHGKIEKA